MVSWVSYDALKKELDDINEKIEEKLRKKNTNDGTIALDGKNGSARKPMMPSFGVIDKFAEGENIWERGEEKRTKVR